MSSAIAGSPALTRSERFARLRALRSDLIDPPCRHHGRVVKRTGDGTIIEFRSVVDAVRCAIEVQSRNGRAQRWHAEPISASNFGSASIFGDVVEETDGDLMGDGVNIAARLESIAAPGAICLPRRLPSGQGAARTRRRRPRPDATQEHRRTDPGLFA